MKRTEGTLGWFYSLLLDGLDDSRAARVGAGAAAAVVHHHLRHRGGRQVVAHGEVRAAHSRTGRELGRPRRRGARRGGRRGGGRVGRLLLDVLRAVRARRRGGVARRADRQVLRRLLAAVLVVARLGVLVRRGGHGSRGPRGGRLVPRAAPRHLDHGAAFPLHQREGSSCHGRSQRGRVGERVRVGGRVERRGGRRSSRRRRVRRVRRGGRRGRRGGRHSAVGARGGDAELLHFVVERARGDLELPGRLQGAHAALDRLDGGGDVAVRVLLVALPFQLLRGHVRSDPRARRVN